MKKFMLISGGFALLFFLTLFAICWYAIDLLSFEKAKNQTAPARAARWIKNGEAKEPIKEIVNPELTQPLKVQSNEEAQ